MTGDLPAAALRLMSQCTVRTHEAKMPLRDTEPSKERWYATAKRGAPIKLCAATLAAQRLAACLPSHKHVVMDRELPPVGPHAIEVNGIVYPSLRQASKAHGITIGALLKWVDYGKANLVDSPASNTMRVGGAGEESSSPERRALTEGQRPVREA